MIWTYVQIFVDFFLSLPIDFYHSGLWIKTEKKKDQNLICNIYNTLLANLHVRTCQNLSQVSSAAECGNMNIFF